jgi:hypothetical protein
MEYNILNILLVLSFSFVSIALGVRWIAQTIIEYKLARFGLMMERLDKKEFERMMEDKHED